MVILRKEIKESLSLVPHKPGCYKYRDEEGRVIYVGKAKNLNKRLSSYFQKTPDDPKTRALLRHFSSIEYMVVETEHDALLLEYNQIREFQPKYNILLKEGNAYPSICIKNEPFPRVFSTHKPQPDGSTYYGPYPQVAMAHTFVRLFRNLYNLRTCNLPLTPEKIKQNKFRVCLQYHIHRCDAPCVGKISEEQYLNYIRDIKEILNGNVKELMQRIRTQMQQHAQELQFEQAQQCKEVLQKLENFQGKSTITSTSLQHALVITCVSDTEAFYVNYLEIHHGNIVSGQTLEYKKGAEQEEDDTLASIIINITKTTRKQVSEILLQKAPQFALPPQYKVSVPQRGDKHKLVELSLANAAQYMQDKQRQREKLNPAQENMRLLKALQSAIGLPTLPAHIECFDNSNISGASPVAACVVFKNARPSKEDYRHFHIQSVTGPNDYASMREVVTRRYTSLLNKNKPLPNLILADGGKGQMSAINDALQSIGITIPVVGLSKDERHRTANVLYGNPPEVIGIMSNHPAFKLLEQIQREVHRFAITFHRKVHSKTLTHSQLNEIPGIGPATQKKLLNHFKSFKRIQGASQQELAEVVGNAKATLLHQHFNPTQS